MSHFYTPWKRQKTKGFLKFSGGIEMWHWTIMGWAICSSCSILIFELVRMLEFLCESRNSLRKKCPCSELFSSVFSHIRIEYGEIRSITPYQSEYRKMRTRITQKMDTFNVVISSTLLNLLLKNWPRILKCFHWIHSYSKLVDESKPSQLQISGYLLINICYLLEW